MEHTDKNEKTLSFLAQFEGPCPGCGFQLHHPVSTKCPECGFALSITLKKPFLCTSWHLFMFGLVASLGVCVDQIGLHFMARFYQGSPIVWGWVLPELFLLIVCFVGIFFWWGARAWANALGHNAKLAIGALGLALPILWFNLIFWIFVLTF
jgi:hypothetical protein